MRAVGRRFPAALLLLTGADTALAWNPDFLRCQFELMMLDRAVREAIANGQALPQSHELTEYLASPEMEWCVGPGGHWRHPFPDDGWPLDPWGNRYVYSPPPPGSPVDPDPAKQPLFRSFGVNGIDDAGLGDDLVSGAPIRAGHYWKRHWPLIPRYIIAFAVGWLLLLLCFRLIPGSWRRHFWPINIAYAAIAGIVTLPLTLSPWVVRGTFHTELGTAWNIAWALLVASVAWLFLSMVWHRWQYSPGTCVQCRYSLKGLPPEATKCPECRAPIPATPPQAPDPAPPSP